jgi:type III pantothenate kinase
MRRASPNEKRNYLLIDVSNSFNKLAFASAEKLTRPHRIETARLSTRAPEEIFRGRELDLVVVFFRRPRADGLIRARRKRFRALFVSAKCQLGVGVDYPEPKTIGRTGCPTQRPRRALMVVRRWWWTLARP